MIRYIFFLLKCIVNFTIYPNQVLGTGDRKILTLSHRAQIRRFTTDLLKILKAQPGKEMPVSMIPAAFGT